MSITASEITFYNATTVSATSSNGGRPDNSAVSPSNQLNNTWPNVLSTERTAGSNLKRKKFMKVADSEDLSLLLTKIYIHKPTGADDYVKMYPGTMRNTQGDLTGSEKPYGTSVLKTSVSSGTTIVVTIEDPSETDLFEDGDAIVMHNMTLPDSVTGDRDFFTISGTPVQVSDEITITTVETIATSYTAAAAWVSTVYEAGTVETEYDNFVVTSSAGTYDDTTYPIGMTNIGTIEQTWTVEFINATTYSVTGDTVGALANGGIAADYEPLNALNGYKYFILESAGFGGTYVAGDTIVFQTHPAMVPLWQERVVPAGSSSFSANDCTLGIVGESE